MVQYGFSAVYKYELRGATCGCTVLVIPYQRAVGYLTCERACVRACVHTYISHTYVDAQVTVRSTCAYAYCTAP